MFGMFTHGFKIYKCTFVVTGIAKNYRMMYIIDGCISLISTEHIAYENMY